VLQGEREMAEDNKTLGRFELVGIPPAPRGVPQIEVSFEIDTDGLVSVSAKDLGTGKQQAIRVTAASGLREDEIQRLVRDAEQHASTDRQRREIADLRNKADGLVYSTERTLQEFAAQVAAPDRSALEAALGRTKRALEDGDAAALQRAVDELSTLSYQMTEKLYASLGGDASGPSGSSSG
jgi:molecular chaperone DnaK